jgi:DNA repair protein RadC
MVNTSFKVAEIEVSYKPKFKASERPQITTTQQAYYVLIANWSLDRIELLEDFNQHISHKRAQKNPQCVLRGSGR